MAKKSMIAKAARKPKFAVRGYTRCQICGRPHSVYKDFGICRVCLRKMANVKFKVKKGDTVKIIAGDDKGKTGKILSVLAKKGQVIVEGCKVAKKAIKPSEKTPNGGFINKEMPIDISNVAKVEG